MNKYKNYVRNESDPLSDIAKSIASEVATALAGDMSNVPAPEMVNFYRNAEQRKLWLDGNVCENMLEYARMIVLWNSEDKDIAPEERKPIWLFIMNYGGDADMMFMFLDLMAASQTPIYTVNMGVAASAAGLIFIGGHKRYMMKNARIVIHEGAASFEGDAVKVIDQTASYKNMLKKMKDYILDHTAIPKTQLSKKRNNDWELDANYCIENKACEYIIESLDDVL